MKLEFNKNFEANLVKKGFKNCSNTNPSIKTYAFCSIRINIYYEQKKVKIFHCSVFGHYTQIKGCKTLNDLYRLESLIEGNQKQTPCPEK